MAEEASGGALRELLAVFGFGVDTKELEKGKDKLGEFLETLKGVAEKVLAAFAVEQIYEFAEGQARAMNAIERTGAQLGITTDRVQEFQFAAKSLGLEADALLNSMGRLQVSQQAAAQGSGVQSKAFHQLGVNVKDASGHFKGADALMLDVADGISKMQDPSQQAAAAVTLFGRSGRELLPFLKQGKDGVEDYFKTFKELGGGYDEGALKAGKEFDKQSAKTNLTLTALKNTIAKALLPIVTAISKGVQVVSKWFNSLVKNSNLLQAALIGLTAVAGAFAVSMAIAFAPILLAAAGVAFLIAVIDDLYTFLTGGDSEIGYLIDKIFGEGAQVSAVKAIKDAWEGVKETFKSLVPHVKEVIDDFKWVLANAEKLGEFFGKVAGKTLQNPDKILGDKSKTPLTPEQREKALDKMHMRQQQAIKEGTSLPVGEFGPLNAPPMAPGMTPTISVAGGSSGSGSSGGGSVDHTVKVQVDAGPGFDAHVTSVTKKERRAAAATIPRAAQ